MACNFEPYEGNEKYIFVSYAHADGETVFPILERLNEAGYRIWYDEGIEWGTEFNEYIATHINNCEAVIAFHSNASNQSEYCKREINYAINIVKKSILSVYLEEVEFSPGMIMQLSPYQSTFWYQYEDKERFFDRLISNTSILELCKGSNENGHVIWNRLMEMRKYIFTCYSHADEETVAPILERLNEAGYRIWYDEGIVLGIEYGESIATHIDKCKAVLVFHSKASSESEYCKREINYAIYNAKKSIVSVYLEDVELSPRMELQLSLYPAIYWYMYEDKEQFFDKLIGALR